MLIGVAPETDVSISAGLAPLRRPQSQAEEQLERRLTRPTFGTS